MGESTQRSGLRIIRGGFALGVTVFLLGGCATSRSADSGEMTFSERGAAVSVDGPAQLDRVEVEQDAGQAIVRLRADRDLAVHTSYRDPAGALIIELPNTRAGRAPGATAYKGALVSAVEVEETDTEGRPLTRVTIRTGGDTEVGGLEPFDSGLRLALLRTGTERPVELAREPLAAAEPLVAEEEIADGPTVVAPIEPLGASAGDGLDSTPENFAAAGETARASGTPDRPLTGPAPTGVVASRLLDVRVEDSTPETTVVTVVGDGEFSYSTFRLEDPERFVLDLRGVVNTASRPSVDISDENVDRIRVGQFRPQPEPVARVVFDLAGESAPRVEGHPDGLTLIFGSPAAFHASAGAPPASPTDIDARAAAEERPPQDQASESWDAERLQAEDVTSTVGVAARDSSTAESFGTGADAEQEVVEGPAFAEPVAPPAWTSPSAEADRPTAEERFGDVELFEAQEMQMPPASEDDSTRTVIPPSFQELVVNERQNDYVGEPISMSLKNADLVETLRSFAKISDLNFVIQPGVGGSVTVELKNVPWDQALEQILRINNLGMDIEGTIVRIAPVAQLRTEAEEERALAATRAESVPLRTVMKAISYATAAEIATLLRNQTGSILSTRGTVQVDSRTNTLIIRELPGNIDTVLAVIENLDTPEPQVSIEARIVEATKTFARTLGIEWGYDGVADAEHGNTTGLVFPNNVESDGGVGLLTGGANGFINLTLGNILNTFNLDARLQVAENEGLVNVISAPRITTLNNTSASIQSGLQIPIQTVSNRTVSVQFVNATLQLTVTPHVTAEGTIMLTINVAKRSPQLGLAIVGAANAPIATKEASTQLIVRDGDTAIIGGIYEVSANAVQSRVPGLANIPILGHLFKNRNRDDSNDELMIFITPRIVQL